MSCIYAPDIVQKRKIHGLQVAPVQIQVYCLDIMDRIVGDLSRDYTAKGGLFESGPCERNLIM